MSKVNDLPVLTPILIVSLVGEPEGLFYGGYRTIFAPIAVALPVVLSVESWRVAHHKIPVVRSWGEQDENDLLSTNGQTRRRVLGFAGVATTSFIGYGAFGENPHREEEIQDNEVIVPDGFEIKNLSHGYFEDENEYRVTATVTTEKDIYLAEAEIEWFVGRGTGIGSTYASLDFGYIGNEPAQLRAKVSDDNTFRVEPAEIERFELEVSQRHY
ncbi:hypothetical protein [Halorubrum laminariae]|uniref:Uncharacterized protein n=1 Tax=Halorubrum laminariae TaxID=1433523 RepID=A0ABD6BWY8_9EURY|nr:hypothetical protein [Halorubrum laminariae]